MIIEGGMRVPCDCILIRGNDINIDEAYYHDDRETVVAKSCSMGTVDENNHTLHPDPFLLSKTLVLSGYGVAVVCAVGKY